VLIVKRRGRSGLRSELAEQWKWRLPFPLWVLILLAPAAIILVAIAIAQGLGAPAGEWNDPGQLYLASPVFLYVVILGGPLGEEFGWRGFALPHLERRIHPTAAVVLLGLIWGLWHLPLFWIEGTVQQLTPAYGVSRSDHRDVCDLRMAVEQDQKPPRGDRHSCRHQHHGRSAARSSRHSRFPDSTVDGHFYRSGDRPGPRGLDQRPPRLPPKQLPVTL
jgi:hypothetical protein